MSQLIPNKFPVPKDQENKKKASTFKLSDINWRGVAVVVAIILVCLVGYIVIRDLSGLGSGFGATVMEWYREGSINPENRKGFTSFLCLLFVAGFIYLILKFTRPNDKN